MSLFRRLFFPALFLFITTALHAQCPAPTVAGSVKICTPAAGATVSSPVTVQASAAPPSGQTITSMRLYVDSVAQTTVSSASLSTSVSMAAGSHNLTVNAWTNTGAVFKATESITVGTTTSCSAAASTVVICTPTNGSSVVSPVSVLAKAGAPSGQTVTAMKLYVDNVAQFSSSSSSLSTSTSMAVGTHNLVVNAWTNTGTVFKSPATTINVTSSNGGAVAVTISPTSAKIAPGATAQFTAQVQNNSDQSVVWSVDGTVGGSSTVGTISTSGLYTAPSTTGQHTVKATANADTTKSASAVVTVATQTSCSPTAGKVTICSPAAGSTVSSPVSFQAVAAAPSGQTISSMRLYIDSVAKFTASGGSLSTSQSLASGTHNITINAWTNTGAVEQAKESITVGSTGPSVSVSPKSASVQIDKTQQFTATVQNSTSGVNWSVDGVDGGNSTVGTISTTGLYTAPGSNGSHTVKATLASDASVSGTAAVTVFTSVSSGNAVTTYMYNNLRTGANTAETQLTPAAVTNGTNFGKKGSWTLDASIYTQPLYVPGVAMSSGTFNVVYVATENDSVYALNADSPGSVLWKRSFLTSTATIGFGYSGGRTSIGSNVGITGTPVIDLSTNRLYVCARTTENNVQTQRLHVIDIRNGSEIASVKIAGSVAGSGSPNDGAGNVLFDATEENQRPGLLLMNGIVYVTFASFGDNDPYHGWVFAYDAGTLAKLGVYNSTPNGGGAGFWASGAAPAGDDQGNLYLATGNGRPNATAVFDPPVDMPNSVLKLHLSGGTLGLVDYFSPYNTRCLTADDLDVASTGPVLIPDAFNGQNLMALGSKEGRAYLVNRDSMGHFQSGSDSQIPSSVLFNPQGPCGSSTFDANSPWRMYGAPVYWKGNIYFASAFGPLRQYSITTGKFQQVALGSHTYAASGQSGRGPLAVLSANGTSGGIVWTAENDLSGNGWLRAYDASNVANQLFSSNYGSGTNFNIPTVAAGKVFVSGHQVLYVYGLLH